MGHTWCACYPSLTRSRGVFSISTATVNDKREKQCVSGTSWARANPMVWGLVGLQPASGHLGSPTGMDRLGSLWITPSRIFFKTEAAPPKCKPRKVWLVPGQGASLSGTDTWCPRPQAPPRQWTRSQRASPSAYTSATLSWSSRP